jgi:hypothetical protein
LLELPSGGRPAHPNRSDGTAPALGRARRRRKRRARTCVQHLSPRCEFRRRGRTGKSRVASRSRFNGMAGAVSGHDLRANQGSGAKRRQGRSCVAQACVRRQAGWMGMVARCRTHSCAWHPGEVWRTDASLGRQRSALPAGQVAREIPRQSAGPNHSEAEPRKAAASCRLLAQNGFAVSHPAISASGGKADMADL